MTLILGDCREILAGLEPESVDAIVTDPPYGIGFMGREWDAFSPEAVRRRKAAQERKGTEKHSERWPEKRGTPQGGGVSVQYNESASGNAQFQAWCAVWAAECLRVLKPGGHLVAFGGPRTYHRLTCGLEDAGFEIRDCLMWLFGSGFPKSHDVSKALDKAAGAEREVVGPGRRHGGGTNGVYAQDAWTQAHHGDVAPETAPATDLARQWDGWGTALKPAYEPIILARKPLIGSTAANVTANGTGAINIDACRIGMGENRTGGGQGSTHTPFLDPAHPRRFPRPEGGRWPANVLLDEDAAALLDQAVGTLNTHGGGIAPKTATANVFGTYGETSRDPRFRGDSGGPSRFFYTAKASRSERNAGLDDLPAKPLHWSSGEQSPGTLQADGTDRTARNHHPTVKPLSLMRWLCRLVTPPGGVILDPFLGSGSTGCAAALERFQFIGIEKEAEYLEIARRRIAYWQQVAEDERQASVLPLFEAAGIAV